MTELDVRVLDFAEAHPDLGAVPAEIRSTFGFSAARYMQHLLRVIETPEAEAVYPQLVHRLQRLVAARAAARAARTFAA